MAQQQDIEQTRTALQTRLQAQAETLERRRTHRFLWAQTSIVLVIGVVVVPFGGVLGLLRPAQQVPSAIMSVVVLLMTLLGWRIYLRTESHARLILAMLYADSVVAVVGYYAIGEFETPNLACVALLVFMVPLFGEKRHAWGIAGLQTALVGTLLALRAAGWLPYNAVLPVPGLGDGAGGAGVSELASRLAEQQLITQLSDPGFVGDSLLGFAVLIFGAAFLAGEASLGLLTSQRELEDEVDVATRKLSRANDELQAQNRALDEFNAALSHDLKSPLASSLLAAESLLFSRPPLPPEQLELARIIADSTERMGELTRELLKLSRMDTDVAAWKDVELDDLVAVVVEDLAAMIADTGARIEIQGPLPSALGNPSLLREAIQNLVENAIKYGRPSPEESPWVRIGEADAKWGRVGLAIEDSGRGVPEEERELIFRPFLQLKRDRGSDGVGAGLAIVQRIVSVHGGSVRVEAGRKLSGARFVLELPRPGTLDSLPH